MFHLRLSALAAEAVNDPPATPPSPTSARGRGPLGALSRREDTALPADANPRSRELAQALYQKAGSDAAFVGAALDYLRTGGFVYSLEPQPLGRDAVDDLLFRTREGFCGHYASAFVTLMRAAHVPARVVTGYLGGEWNPIGEFVEVRQSDAHAWAEVWLEGRGWTRMDPTAVVAPARLERHPGADARGLPASDRLLYHSALSALLQRWDAANAWWSDHLVSSTTTASSAPRPPRRAHARRATSAGRSLRHCCCGWASPPGTSAAARAVPPRPAGARICRCA